VNATYFMTVGNLDHRREGREGGGVTLGTAMHANECPSSYCCGCCRRWRQRWRRRVTMICWTFVISGRPLNWSYSYSDNRLKPQSHRRT